MSTTQKYGDDKEEYMDAARTEKGARRLKGPRQAAVEGRFEACRLKGFFLDRCGSARYSGMKCLLRIGARQEARWYREAGGLRPYGMKAIFFGR